MEEAVYSRLSTFAGLTALVSTRIFPDRAPEGQVFPLVTFQRISTSRPSAFGVDAGLAIVRIQVVGWATTKASALAIAKQLRAALRRWRGTVLGVVIQDSYLDAESARFDESLTAPGTGTPGIYGMQIDARIVHEEA